MGFSSRVRSIFLFPCSLGKSQNTERFWNAARVTTCSVTTRKKSLSVVTFLKKKHKQTKTKRNKSTWDDFFDGKKCVTTFTREI